MNTAPVDSAFIDRLGDQSFEYLCVMLSPVIAQFALNITGARLIKAMARSHDGGVEAKAGVPAGRVAGIQAKAYNSSVSSEQTSVEQSLKRVLSSTEHSDITDFVWCSRRPGRSADTKVSALHDAFMLTLQSIVPPSRNLTVHFLSSADLAALLANNPPLLSFLSAGVVLDSDDINRWSTKYISAALQRVGGPDAPTIEFESPLTGVLEEFSGLRAFGHRQEQISRMATRLRNRAAGINNATDALEFRQLTTSVSAIVDAWVSGSPLDNATRDFDAVSELIDFARKVVNSPEFGPARPESIGHQCLALARELLEAGPLDEAIRSRFLILSGAWGTGKTYHLAKLGEKIIREGGTVLFVRARDLPKVASTVFSGPVATIAGPQMEEKQLLLTLDAAGRTTTDTLVIVDGVNEWQADLAGQHTSELRLLAKDYPHMRFVVSIRNDHDSSQSRDVTYFHRSPDVASMSKAFESATGAFPGTAWRAALMNPLLARVAALVAVMNPTAQRSGAQRFGILSLLERWTDVVADETSARWPEISAFSVRGIVAWVGQAEGNTPLLRAEARAQFGGAPTDRILDALVDSGLLLDRDDEVIQFRFQGFAQAAQVRASLTRGSNDVKELLKFARPEDYDFLLDVLGEALITSDVEICDYPGVREMPAGEVLAAFARALAHRHKSTVTTKTIEHMDTALRSRDTAWMVLLAALVSAGEGFDGVVSPQWFVSRLNGIGVGRRSRVWPLAITDLLSKDDNIDVVRQLLASVLGRITSTSPLREPLAFALFLTWLGCDQGTDGMRDTAAQLLTELLHRHAHITPSLLQGVSATPGEDHRLEMVLAACLGVRARWPQPESTTQIVRDVRESAKSLRPRSWTVLIQLYLLGSDSDTYGGIDLQTYLVSQGAAIRRRNWRAALMGHVSPWAISPYAADTFVDGRSRRETAGVEDRIARELGLTYAQRRQLRRQHRAEETGRSLRPSDERQELDLDHASSLVERRWLAEQYARFPRGDLFVANMGVMKSGGIRNPGAMITSVRRDPSGFIDTSIPAALGMKRSDTVRQKNLAPRLSNDPSLDDFRIYLDGESWIVLGGRFRYLNPAPEPSDPMFAVGRKITRSALRHVDGLPTAGEQLHQVLSVESIFYGSPSPKIRTEPMLMWAERIRSTQFGPAIDVPHDAPPTPTGAMLRLLNATWTGEGVDCVADEGKLVITDPDQSGPPCVAVHEMTLLDALREGGRSIVLRVRLVNLRQHWDSPLEVELEFPERS
ncbi:MULTISPECIES: hypothetical protein [unclassified Cryobacterium]|uniref:hypothetical protein n=1 Tax=unclassified Cryobacterium TaxID=2649013 RepID=UPI00106B20F7|nr:MULTISPECIES: hypothetical protein [unclassified Cryobacterium]TFC50348.1 hypothetical protein E3O68_18295 [Cryobacterium sp. TMB3-1-2]TFC71917.1 hypothetical protein E3T21_07105 [Cryobacterium sp. TMB3-15]TFC78510.1 hypothetical protein E3T22_03300 [Cryobacterium sp. TMB3-10]TFD44567.1 hypothetical protein E3T58_04360 [Cryobacterium sp. TMB3-12]